MLLAGLVAVAVLAILCEGLVIAALADIVQNLIRFLART